ncbi:hypothetical protein Y788_13705 [Pantoea dispersa 625]|nr:hypothetical protein Y788_13705 [Pantoea dispersa 625]
MLQFITQITHNLISYQSTPIMMILYQKNSIEFPHRISDSGLSLKCSLSFFGLSFSG